MYICAYIYIEQYSFYTGLAECICVYVCMPACMVVCILYSRACLKLFRGHNTRYSILSRVYILAYCCDLGVVLT